MTQKAVSLVTYADHRDFGGNGDRERCCGEGGFLNRCCVTIPSACRREQVRGREEGETLSCDAGLYTHRGRSEHWRDLCQPLRFAKVPGAEWEEAGCVRWGDPSSSVRT